MRSKTPPSLSLHPPAADLELYVMGALEAGPTKRLERHVRACGACAAALAEEARLETTLRAIVPRLRAREASPTNVVALPVAPLAAPPAARPAAVRRAPRSSALAAAAALVVGVWGLSADRIDHAGSRALVQATVSAVAARDQEAAGAGLVCAADGAEALCRLPVALAARQAVQSLEAPATAPARGAGDVCRAPIGGLCSIQSRMPFP